MHIGYIYFFKIMQVKQRRKATEKELLEVHLQGDTTIVPSQRHINTSAKKREMWKYLGMVSQFGFTIAIPIALGAIIGSELDKRWNTYPKTTVLLLVVGIAISITNFFQLIMSIMRKK